MGKREDAEKSDAEAFEDVKARALEALQRAADALDRGETFDEMMYAAAAGMKTVVERVAMADLKELGSFSYERKGRRWIQWVYRHRQHRDLVYCIGWQHRFRLQNAGYTEMEVFRDDPRERS